MHPRDSWEVMACTDQDSWCSCLKQVAYSGPGTRFRPRLDPDQRAQYGFRSHSPTCAKPRKPDHGLKNGESLGEDKAS